MAVPKEPREHQHSACARVHTLGDSLVSDQRVLAGEVRCAPEWRVASEVCERINALNSA